MKIAIFIISTLVLIVIIYFFTKKNGEGIKPIWWSIAFVLKVLAGILLVYIYLDYYSDRESADMFKYYDDGRAIWESTRGNNKDFVKIVLGIYNKDEYELLKDKYLFKTNHWDRADFVPFRYENRLIIRINAALMPLTGGNFGLHILLFIFIAFIGQYFLFKSIAPFVHKKTSFLIIFLFPSLLLWTSGILKEAIIIFIIGLWFYGLKMLIDKKYVLSVILLLISTLIAATVKVYIIIGLYLSILPLIIYKIIKKYKVWQVYLCVFFIYILSIPLLKYLFGLDLLTLIVNKLELTTNLAISENAGSMINPLKLDPTLFSFIINAPLAIINTFFRPFINDINSLIIIPSFIENLILILLTIIAIIFRKKEITQKEQNILLFFLSFVIIETLLIGYTTPILGATVRYRIFPMLFFLLSLIIVNDFEKIKYKLKIKKYE
ncbi:MAG TPA: hypothetical protein PLQ91_01795 [Bacteroidales bacterium]|nr:hypothetical protein [Bacteroidales bacterium]HXK91220.1 hypothetical protein [Bacteroidales bacterium]